MRIGGADGSIPDRRAAYSSGLHPDPAGEMVAQGGGARARGALPMQI